MMNANDEITENFENGTISISLYDDNKTIEINDSGRGIPIGETIDNVPAYELLFETLFAGTNFENLQEQRETTGTNGCGLTVLNYTSEKFEARSYKNNVEYVVSYENGGQNRKYESCKRNGGVPSGSTFCFKLDENMYTETEYVPEEIMSLCNRLSGVSPKIEICFIHNGQFKQYHYDSIYDYFTRNCEKTFGDAFQFVEKKNVEKIVVENTNNTLETKIGEVEETHRMKLVFSLGTTEPFQETFLNYTYLKENGAIYDGVIEGFRKVFDKYAGNKVKITAADIEMGLNFVCSLWTNNVEFSNQTKFSTKKRSYKKAVVEYVVENLEIFKIENEKLFNNMVKHFIEINSFNKKAENDIKNLKKKIQQTQTKANTSINLPGLRDANMKKSKMEDRILIIDEGLSANSTIMGAFDNDYMGCYGLTGRFINSYKSNINAVFSNEPAIGIMTALGCGIELPEKDRKRFKDLALFDKSKLRYGSVAIICDADSFGKGITLSLLCYFHKFYPTLCEEGRIYTVSSPRFVIYDKKNEPHYAYNDADKERIIKDLGKNVDHIGIVKGLGELDAEEFWDYVLSPEAREKTFTQVNFSGNNEEIEKLFEITMGKDVEPRRDYIVEHIVEAL